MENTKSPGDEVSQSGKSRKRGRPKVNDPNAAKLPLDRRLQLREAQKKYRQKKEASLESYKARTYELEERLKKIAEVYSGCHVSAKDVDLGITHPEVFGKLEEMRKLLGPELGALRPDLRNQPAVRSVHPDEDAVLGQEQSNESNSSSVISSFGYQLPKHPNLQILDDASAPKYTRTQALPVDCAERALSPGLRDTQRLLGGSVPFSYSFHETTFYRRIHRYCLEHAYRLFSDPRSDPTTIFKLFRLVPCIKYKAKMLPYFERLVQGGTKDTLELPKLPFYCIGGAGSHYPHKDSEGNPAELSNTRMPKRILGIVPSSDGSRLQEDTQRHLELFGLDGEWFDCQDVEGYLEEKGVILDQTSVFAEIQTSWLRQMTFSSSDYLFEEQDLDDLQNFDFGTDMNFEPRSNTPTEIELPSSLSGSSRPVLDIGHFLSRLLHGFVILGRAPGFKRSDVETAFSSALRIHTSI
ncbi:hypothetical protein B0J14DRAFT_266162 [Halenospora varia]|nr:hypothetical protein B0J14DRAFT_266162 [Halenospora varia]